MDIPKENVNPKKGEALTIVKETVLKGQKREAAKKAPDITGIA